MGVLHFHIYGCYTRSNPQIWTAVLTPDGTALKSNAGYEYGPTHNTTVKMLPLYIDILNLIDTLIEDGCVCFFLKWYGLLCLMY